MVGVVEDDDGVAAGVPAGDLHGVLDGLGAGVEQRRALVVVAGGEPVERLAHLDVPLVRGHHEAGVGELGDLGLHPRDDLGGGVADVDDGDAGAEVDELVAVDVDEDAAARRSSRRPAAWCRRPAATAAVLRACSACERGPGQLGHEHPALLDAAGGGAGGSRRPGCRVSVIACSQRRRGCSLPHARGRPGPAPLSRTGETPGGGSPGGVRTGGTIAAMTHAAPSARRTRASGCASRRRRRDGAALDRAPSRGSPSPSSRTRRRTSRAASSCCSPGSGALRRAGTPASTSTGWSPGSVAAVGFGVGVLHEEIPPGLVLAADAAAGLPLLEVDRPTPFIAVSKAAG